MTAVDTNILVYAHRADSQFHRQAATVVRGLAEGQTPWLLPWPCLHEFLAVTTHPRIYSAPSTVEQALSQVDAWLESPSVLLTSEGETYWDQLRAVCERSGVTGPRIHDARVAALCLENGVTELLSCDRDFSRFPIIVRNPL